MPKTHELDVEDIEHLSGAISLEYVEADRHAGRSPDLSKTGDMFERAWEGRQIRGDS